MDDPARLEQLVTRHAKTAPDALKPLWQEPHITEISNTIKADKVGGPLNTDTLERCKLVQSYDGFSYERALKSDGAKPPSRNR